MKYVMTFARKTAAFRLHVATCQAAGNTKHQVRMPGTFETIQAANEAADQDEWERSTRDDVKADFKVCKCCKG